MSMDIFFYIIIIILLRWGCINFFAALVSIAIATLVSHSLLRWLDILSSCNKNTPFQLLLHNPSGEEECAHTT